MTKKSNEYRAEAAKCDHQAKQAKGPEVRQRYLDLAKVWRILADYVEPNETKTRTRFTRQAA